jgi:hypothetical protein
MKFPKFCIPFFFGCCFTSTCDADMLNEIDSFERCSNSAVNSMKGDFTPKHLHYEMKKKERFRSVIIKN